MEYTILSKDWNADPNSAMPVWHIEGNDLIVEFYLNYFVYPQFKEDDRGKITFINCHKYHFSGTNDEGYYRGKHRYNQVELPWGEFYKVKTDWKIDFPQKSTSLSDAVDESKLNHYVFFFRDEIMECVAEDYRLMFINAD